MRCRPGIDFHIFIFFILDKIHSRNGFPCAGTCEVFLLESSKSPITSTRSPNTTPGKCERKLVLVDTAVGSTYIRSRTTTRNSRLVRNREANRNHGRHARKGGDGNIWFNYGVILASSQRCSSPSRWYFGNDRCVTVLSNLILAHSFLITYT